MPQVVTAENFVEFVQTGKVAEFKPPEAPKADAPADPAKETSADLPRDASEKFTKQNEPAKSETAAAPKKEIADEDLSEVVRQKIDKKHRQMKEAEEIARSETLRAVAAERRAEQLQRDLEAAKKSGPAPVPEAPKEPKPADFATVAEYTDALVSYRVDQRLREEADRRTREAEEREREARQRDFGKRLNDAKAKHDDFEEVLTSIKGTDLDRVHQDVTEYIQESEQGAELLYHLAKNPDVLDRLRKLSPRRFIAELGKLEAKWEETPAKPASETQTLTGAAQATATPAVSKAPAPIAALSSDAATVVHKDPATMSFQELREYRKQQEREKAARR